MVYIKKHKFKNTCFVQLLTPQKNILFDYHASLYGQAHRHPSFNSPPKPLKFVIKNIQNADCLFISSSDSIGCLFAEADTRIYCTKPVYDQLMMLYDEYRSMAVTYDEDPGECRQALDSGCRIAFFSEIDIENFRKNAILIKYNQRVSLDSTTVCAVSPGTFIGWANYEIVFPNQESLTYLASYSCKRRFSTESAPVGTTYLVINRERVGDASDLGEFTEFLRTRFGGSKKDVQSDTVVIPVRIPTLFVEVFFHVLSVLDYTKTPIYVVSPIFSRLELFINIQSEWLNRDFCSIAEPFPMRQYRHLFNVDSFNCDFQEQPQIVFCSPFYYGLFGGRSLFPSQTDVFVNTARASPCPSRQARHFNIKMEASDREILSGYGGVLIDSDDYFINTEPPHKTINLDGNMNIVNDVVYVSGTLLNTDFLSGSDTAISVADRGCWIKELLETGEYAVVDDWIVFREKRLKCRFLNSYQIEYKYF